MYSVYLLELQNKEVLRQSEKFFPPPTNSVAGESVPEQPPTHTQAHAGQIPLRDKRVQRSTAPRTPQKLRFQGGVCVRKGGVG